MDFKKFKHNLQKEKLIIPSMSDKLKNYAKQEIVYKEKKEKIRISFAPLFKYSYLLIPILIMLLTVTITSISSFSNRYKYELYTVESKQDLLSIVNYRNDYEMDGLIFGGSFDSITNSAPGWGWSDEVKDFGPQGSAGDKGETNQPDYSETNKQEQNVDESDIVKTDGNNIYYVNSIHNMLYHYNVNTQKISSVSINNSTKSGLYINDKYVILLQYGDNLYANNQIIVNVYDKETLELVNNYIGEGVYIDSRVTDNILYLIYIKHDVEEAPCDIIDSEEHIYDYNDIKYSPATINRSITFVVAMDLDSLETNVHLQLGAYIWEAVYMTEESLYLASSNYCYQLRMYTMMGSRFTTATYQTNIFRFKLDGINIEYQGIIITSGKINNQFYLDEYDNHLRVVLQQQNTEYTGNNKLEVYSLEKYSDAGVFKKVASIDEGIGKVREQIKSVRFSDTSCLIVTFLQTDPLYYIDLTDQLKPKIIAGYEEPGYNTYLHYINDKLAIGFGVLVEGNFEIVGDELISSNNKVGLYCIEDGIPNKVDENVLYWYISVVTNHKALYIEGEVFGFGGEYISKKYDSTGYKKYEIYDIYTIDYEGDTPKLKLIKRFSDAGLYYKYDNYYERMLRINENYYLVTKDSIEILNSNFDIQKHISLYEYSK